MNRSWGAEGRVEGVFLVEGTVCASRRGRNAIYVSDQTALAEGLHMWVKEPQWEKKKFFN